MVELIVGRPTYIASYIIAERLRILKLAAGFLQDISNDQDIGDR